MSCCDGNEPVLGIYKKNDSVILPKYATQHSACFDLVFNENEFGYLEVYDDPYQRPYPEVEKIRRYSTPSNANFCYEIFPGERVMVPTGIIFNIPIGYCIRIYSRSGLALKSGLVVVNSPGIIDADYHHECFVLLHNVSSKKQYLYSGDRIAQAELAKVAKAVIVEHDQVIESGSDRNGGFGSTGRG